MRSIDIHSSLYDYSVYFIEDCKKEIESFGDKAAYVIDGNIYRLYNNLFSDISKEKVFLMPAVEHEKNMETVMKIIYFLKDAGVKKDWKVICFGGGITQDVTTIASNLFLRNVDWYFFPTTLLAMCDSCIGGKCGINLGQYKNQIGVFYPPKKIYIDIRFLDTLSYADHINGWGELLKFSLTDGEEFYDELSQEDEYVPCKNIEEYIFKGLMVKKKVIEEDEFESDLRRILNYGHTFGHALEAYTNNEIPHGTAVIWGIDVVNYIAAQEGLIDEDYYLEVKKLIKDSFIREVMPIDEPRILFDIIKTDKKVKNNKINLAILDGRSHLIVFPMDIDEKLEKMFETYIEETNEYYNS